MGTFSGSGRCLFAKGWPDCGDKRVCLRVTTRQKGRDVGFRDRLKWIFGTPEGPLEAQRRLELDTGYNARELGGYATGMGETRWHRFVRSGELNVLSRGDQRRLGEYGVSMVVDLRGDTEVRAAPDHFSEMGNVRFLHVPLYDFDLSDPKLEVGDDKANYYSLGYFTILANKEGIRQVFSFFATAKKDDCVLFHCAVGMDRTGVTAMLLLGLVDASVDRIVADYCYSFGTEAEVDRCVFGDNPSPRREIAVRLQAMRGVYGQLLEAYGSAERYLLSCGVTEDEIARIRAHLLEP